MKQLLAEKKRLRRQQEELEGKIQKTWVQLKKKLHPGSMAKEAFSNWMDKKSEPCVNGSTILSSTLSYGASFLAKKFAEKAEKKWDAWRKKGTEL